MENKFTEVMSGRTDEALIKIVTVDIADYEPLAVEAAELEIKKRQISGIEFEQIEAKVILEKDTEETLATNTANKGIRFLNALIDSVIFLILTAIFTSPLKELNSSNNLIGLLIILGLFIVYFGVMEAKFQKTLGKFITKTKVVNLKGDKPDNNTITYRTICRLIPFDALSYLFLEVGMHDRFSNTQVVTDNSTLIPNDLEVV